MIRRLPSLYHSSTSRKSGLGKLRLLKTLAALAIAGPSAAAHADEPMRRIANMFDPLSKPAAMIHDASIITLIICSVIFIVVMGMMIYVIVKFRSRGAIDDRKEPPQIYGSSQIELAWTVIPIIITVVLILITTRTIGEIQDHAVPKDALHIRVIGHQWWWEIHYQKPGAKPDEWVTDFTIANEIHVPVNKHTEITLESADVLHSFWVAQLNGKTDLIPGLKNRTWIEPTTTGIFFGNCAEYCGTQHANMQLKVFVQTPEDFAAWETQQRAPAPAPMTADAIAGKRVFYANSCVNCHKIDGTTAVGVFGPDLSHLASRMTIGAGVALNNQENLRTWMHDPATLKTGVLMPNMQLNDQEVDQVVAFLMTLK